MDNPPMDESGHNPSANTVPDWWPAEARQICALADMPKNAARGFTLTGPTARDRLDIIIWANHEHENEHDNESAALKGFVNKCPHMGLPLETFPDRFLNAAGDRLICSAHGARFDAGGACVSGPCQGASLYRLDLRLEGGMIILPPQKPNPAAD